jgi:predicted PurR-regulated permease PerM
MALLSKKNKQEEKNDPANYFNLKEYNRKKIKNQDALFVISAIIIIIALIGLVSFFINFVVSQINLVFQDVSTSTAKIEVFDEKNFNEIKDKLIGVEDLKKQLEELLESETSTELNTARYQKQLLQK